MCFAPSGYPLRNRVSIRRRAYGSGGTIASEEDFRLVHTQPHLQLALATLLSLTAVVGCTAPSAVPVPGDTEANATASLSVAPAASPAGCEALTDGIACADPTSMAEARVIRIVDGDTLHVELNGRDETVRLYGVDAPEVGQPCAADATARLRDLAGADVLLRADARDGDRYGRLLRYVYARSGSSIDAALVRDGLAHAWRADGALRIAIGALEDAARASRRGCLWNPM